MLRLFAKRGVRLAPFHTAHQHPSRRTFYTGQVVKSPELSEDQIGAPSNAKPDRLCCRGSENNLWERVEKIDDRVAGVAKDLGNVKSDVCKEIGELQRAMEKGFGEVIAAIEGCRGDVKDQIGDVNGQIGDVEDQIGDVEDQIGDVKGLIGDVKGQIGDVKGLIGDFKAEIQPIVWQVRLLLGGVSLAVGILVENYIERHNIFTKKQSSATPPISRDATQVVSSELAGVPTLG